jgi:putative MATE family efflux protein
LKKPTKDLTQGPVLGHLLRMALPMMIGMTAHMVQNIYDGVLAGRLGIHESMAVLNYGFPFFYLIFAVLNGLSTGATSILSRLLGAGEDRRAADALGQIAWINMGIVLTAGVLYPFVLPWYLDAQGASPEAAALTWKYLNALFLGFPFTALALVWGSGLRAEGNTRTLMNGMMLGTLSNVIAAPFLIFETFRFAGVQWTGFGLGVTGAGLATTLGGVLMSIYIGSVYFRGTTRIKFRWLPGWADRSGVRETFGVGLPSILSQALIGVNLAIMTHLAARFGEHGVAAIGIGLRLDIISVFPSLALMVAVLSFTGQNYGAGRFDRVRAGVRTGLLVAAVSLLAVGLLVYVLRGPIIGLFQPDAATTQSARHFIGAISMGYAFVGMGIVASGAFQGLGRGAPFLTLTILRLVLISAPVAWFLSTFHGEHAFHYAPLIASVFSGTVAVLWITSTVRRLDKAAKAAVPPPSV